MMKQKSMAGVQKYMHQFNKGTRKDRMVRKQGIIKMILCSRKWKTALEMPEDYSYRNMDYGFYRSVLNRIEEIEKKIA